MLIQPQRPAAPSSRPSIISNAFGRKNSSVVSFTSSSNEGYDAEGSRSASMRNSQSGSSRGHQRHDPHSAYNAEAPSSMYDSSDVEYSKSSTFGRRAKKVQSQSHDSSFAKHTTASSKGVGTLRGLGRRLFNRSNSNLKPAALLTSRSHSASSDSTNAQSPPLTPTTPPPVQPVWLPNGQKDFFANFSSIPSSVQLQSQQKHNIRVASDSTITDISPKTRQDAFSDFSSSFDHNRDLDGASSTGHSASFSQRNSSDVSLPSTQTVAAPSGFSSTLTPRREIPAVIEEEADSDFLRAVLNFGEGQDEAAPSPSFRGGRAAPLPTRSSSLAQIAGLTASPSSYVPSPMYQRPPLHRTPDGRVVLTQSAAKDYATEKPRSAYRIVNKQYRKGLFGADSDSEDEYGEDGEQESEAPMVVAPGVQQQVKQNVEPTSYPSSFAKSRTHSPSNEATTRSPPGLDTAAKKAIYNCTLLKVHMHLAPTLAADVEARSLVPVIAAGETLYSNEDLKFPRSINSESTLRNHSSTYGFSRNLHVALARTSVMRKLRRDRLSIEEEVEISWFQRRYGSASIATDQIAKALRQRQMVSPEALAKAPIAAPSQPQEAGSAARRMSKSDGRNGIVAWAQRPGYLERSVVLLPAEEIRPGEVLMFGSAKLADPMGGAAVTSSSVSFSPRIRALAGLPSVEEERRLKYAHKRGGRPREDNAKRGSRLGSASDGAVWEGPDRRASSVGRSPLASPSTKQRRLPPWLAPANPQLLSPRSMANLRPARSASEGLTAFATLHQNSSTTSIPEVKESGDDSSDEEVPLAQLHTFRAQRSAERERIQALESQIALLKQKEIEREKEEEERKSREEEARRIEAERAYEERKAQLEARKLEKNRRILQEARDRRGFTRQSVLLSEPNYGAGNPLLSPPTARNKAGSSPSSPNLGLEATMSPGRATHHDSALAKLQGNKLASRSTTTLYAQQEGQRRSRTSVVVGAGSPVQEPVSPLVELHRHGSMVNLGVPAVQQTLPHRRSMAALPAAPQVAPRRTSLMPPPPDSISTLHPAASMQHLFPAGGSTLNLHPMPPSATAAHLVSPTSPLQTYADPRLSMSMTNLHAQAYLQAQQQQAQMSSTLQRPTMAQTAKISSRTRPKMTPLVSLYGDVVPSSAQAPPPQGWR